MSETQETSSEELAREIHDELALFPKNFTLDRNSLQEVVKSLRVKRPDLDWSLIDVPENMPAEVVRVIGQSLEGGKSIQVRVSLQKISVVVDAIPDTSLDAKTEFAICWQLAVDLRDAITNSVDGLEDISIKRFGLIRQMIKRVDLSNFATNLITAKVQTKDFTVRTTETSESDGVKYNLIKTYESALFKNEQTPIVLLAIDFNSNQDQDLDSLLSNSEGKILGHVEKMDSVSTVLDTLVKPYEKKG